MNDTQYYPNILNQNNIAYKVVRGHLTPPVSFLSIVGGAKTINYKIGEKVWPKSGKIFVFNSLISREGLRKFWELSQSLDCWQQCPKGTLGTTSVIPIEIIE